MGADLRDEGSALNLTFRFLYSPTRRRVACIVVLVLYALASASIGFAHRFNLVPADLAQFVLPDGTLPTICGGDNDDDSRGQSAHSQTCDACCLTHAPGLPPSQGQGAIRIQMAVIDFIPWREPAQTLLSIRAHRPRGPPV